MEHSNVIDDCVETKAGRFLFLEAGNLPRHVGADTA